LGERRSATPQIINQVLNWTLYFYNFFGLTPCILKLLCMCVGHPNTLPFGHETSRDLVHKFVFLGDDRNIARVLVNGVVVKDILQAAP